MKFLLDTHTHTIASGHAYSTIEENARMASRAGMELMSVTDHGPEMIGSVKAVFFLNLKVLPNTIEGVEILPGVELNILNSDGAVDLSNGILKKLKTVIASLHQVCIKPAGIEENTRAVLNTMRNPYIRIIGHLGDPAFPINIAEVVSEAGRLGKILEINNTSLTPGNYRYDSDAVMKILKCCNDMNTYVVAGSDAHFCSDVGGLDYAKKIIERSGIREELVLNTDVSKYKKALEVGRA